MNKEAEAGAGFAAEGVQSSWIEIIETNGMWAAEFHGGHRSEIEDLFGQAIVPTAFQVSVSRELVVQEIQMRNSSCKVV